MYSKFIIYLGIVAALLSLSCSKWLHEDPPPNTAIELSKDKTRCLRNWSDIVDKYLLGRSSQAEIEDFWNCLDSVVWYFQKHTEGDRPGVYSVTELKRAVEELFLKREIPGSFVERFKDLKRAIFSGDRENFNQEDLRRLHLMLAEFKFGTTKMLRHIPYLNFTAKDDTGLDAAIADLELVVGHWMTQISPIHASYKLEDLLRFWSEFKQVLEIKAFELTEDKWTDVLHAARLVKSLILGAPGEEILQSDWPLVYQRSADAYTISLLYHYRLKGKPWNIGAAVPALKKASELALRGIKESTRRHPDGRISSEEFMDLAEIAKKNKWVNFGNINLPSLKAALMSLLRTVLNDGKAPVDTERAYLTANGLVFLEQEIGRWLVVQSAINEVLRGSDALLTKEFEKRWSSINKSFEEPSWAFYGSESNAALEEFLEVVRRTPYLTTLDSGSQVVFQKDRRGRGSVDVSSLSHLNWMTRVSRLILKGYGSIDKGVTAKSFDRFYREFRDFGIDLGLLDPNTYDSGTRTHLEANTFTDAANGDGWVTKLESIHELQILLSGGAGATKIVEGLIHTCQIKNQKCTAESPQGLLLDANAVEQYLTLNFEKVFANLPLMVKEFNAATFRERQYYVHSLVAESQKEKIAGGWMNISMIRHVVGLLHFAESIFLRYDSDGSMTVDAVEVRNAFNVFQGFLEQAIWSAKQEKVDPESLFVGFVYFLKYGESLVQSGGFWSKIPTLLNYYGMKSDIDNRKVQLTRVEIVRAMIRFRNFAAGS